MADIVGTVSGGGGGGGGGGTGYATIQDNGISAPQETTLNFVGTNVLALTDVPGVKTNATFASTLVDIAGLTPTSNTVIYGNGTHFSTTSTTNTNLIYISTTGNDTTGDGSQLFPYLTIFKANSVVTGNTAQNQVVIYIEPGRYHETHNILLKPFVTLFGYGSVSSYITSPNNIIAPDPSYNTGSGRSSLINIYIGGSTSINFDLFSLTTGNSGVLDMYNCVCNGSIIFTGRVVGADELFMLNCYAFGDLHASNCAGGQFTGSFVEGNVIIDTANTTSANSNVTFEGFQAVNWTLTSSGSLTNTVTVNDSTCFGTMAISGSGTTVSIDAVSLPALQSSLTISGSPTITYTTNAYGVFYNPATPGNWSPAPTFVNTALDQLAARSSGGLSFTVITANTTLAANTGYIVNAVGQLTLTLPTTFPAGAEIRIVGYAGGWTINQNAGQSIAWGSTSTTLGASGHLTSTLVSDCLDIVAVNANTTFVVADSNGNITVA